MSSYHAGVYNEIGKTDDRGVAQFQTPASLKPDPYDEDYDSPTLLMVDVASQNPFFIKPIESIWYIGGLSAAGDSYWDYLSTDRYTYRLTDTVNVWGIVKGRDADIRQMNVDVSLYKRFYSPFMNRGYLPPSQEEEPIISEVLTVNESDSYQGKLRFQGIDPWSVYNYYII